MLAKDMLEKVLAAYCSSGRQLEIESTVHWGAVGGGLGWGKDLGNLLERLLSLAEARIRMLAKGRWSVDLSQQHIKVVVGAGTEAARVKTGAQPIQEKHGMGHLR